MARVFDASWQRPAADDPRLSPGDGLIFYVSRTADKCPTLAEVQTHRGAGHVVRRVFEDSAVRASTGSYADGAADGRLTLAVMQQDGHAAGEAAYYACDTNEPLNLDYARGFGDGLTSYYEPRCYGGDRNLIRAGQVGQRLGWQASAASWSDFWDFGAAHGSYPAASLYQFAGPSPIPGTDLNIINHPAWAGGNGDPVATLDADDLANIAKAVWTHQVLQENSKAGHSAQYWLEHPNIVLAPLASQVGSIAAKVGALTPQAFAAAISPLLLPALTAAVKPGQPITLDMLETALTDVLGSLNDPATS